MHGYHSLSNIDQGHDAFRRDGEKLRVLPCKHRCAEVRQLSLRMPLSVTHFLLHQQTCIQHLCLNMGCLRRYHMECIDQWLSHRRAVCPICKCARRLSLYHAPLLSHVVTMESRLTPLPHSPCDIATVRMAMRLHLRAQAD